MPVALQDPISSSIANGITTVFPFQFLVPSADSLKVEVNGVLTTTGFSVSGVGSAAGGNITFAVPPVNGARIVRYRDLDAKRDFDWAEGGDLLAATHDANDDYAIMLVQQLMEALRRTPTLPRGHVLTGAIELPEPGAGQALRWNVDGTNLETFIYDVLGTSFTQSGAGGLPRAWTSKVGEAVSVGDFASLAAAITNAAGEERVIYCSGVIPIPDSYTVPANITLRRGSRKLDIQIALNKTLTIQRQPEFGRYKVFSFDAGYTFTSYGVPAPGTFLIPVSFDRGGVTVYPEWFGAGETSDDRAAIQAAHDSLWQRGVLDFDSRAYFINSAGRTNWTGELCGIFGTNDRGALGHTTGQNNRPAVTWRGKGLNNTVFTAKQSLNLKNVLGFYYNGEGAELNGFSVTVERDAGIVQARCLYISGNGIDVKNVYTGGGKYGTYNDAGGAITLTNCWDEFSDYGHYCFNAYGTVYTACQAYQPTISGFFVYGRLAGIGSIPLNQQLDPIQLIGSKSTGLPPNGVGLGIDIEGACPVGVVDQGCLWGAHGGQTAVYAGGIMNGSYSLSIAQCYQYTATGTHFFHTKYGSYCGPGVAAFNGCLFSGAGIYDQVTAPAPYAVRALWVGIGAYVTLSGSVFQNCAGEAIYNEGALLLATANQFIDCANGGLTALLARAGVTSAVVGNAVIRHLPKTTGAVLKLHGNHFYAPAGESAGKTGLAISGATAVPAGGNVHLLGNTVEAGSFATPFALSGITTLQKNAWHIKNDQLAPSTPDVVPTYTDAEAPNMTRYYSSTAGKYVFKDGAGAVAALH
jgi:hypothetical protein